MGAHATATQDKGPIDLRLIARYIESNKNFELSQYRGGKIVDVESSEYRGGRPSDAAEFSSMSDGAVAVQLVGSNKHLLVIVSGTLEVASLGRKSSLQTSHMLLVSHLGADRYEITYFDEDGKYGPYEGRRGEDRAFIQFEHRQEGSSLINHGHLTLDAAPPSAVPAVVFILETDDGRTRQAPNVRLRFYNEESASFQSCKTNMRTVANAVQAHHVRNRLADYFYGEVNKITTGPGALLEDLTYLPFCPGNESLYFVTGFGKDGFAIRCGDPAHVFRWENGVFMAGKR